jgi:hypothetical protein
MIQIKNRWNGETVYEADVGTVAEAVVAAVAAKVNLFGADLYEANLSEADLRWANLRWANLSGVNLSEADLRWANLSGADLVGANLFGANLSRANLSRADLSGADLVGADLSEANLVGANLKDARNCNFLIVPEIGSFIGFKKCSNGNILKLRIPADAGRVNKIGGRKCRAEYVYVLGYSKKIANTINTGTHHKSLSYVVGQYIQADGYNDDPREECTDGIHFFMTLKEAEEWK